MSADPHDESTLTGRFLTVLKEAARATDRPALDPVRQTIGSGAARLGTRMGVAVVGRVSQGKSTLVNALIGDRLTPTGALELSYSINRVRYGDAPSLTVHHRDGTSFPADLDELERYAARAADNQELLAAIDHLEVVCPSRHLTGFDLIDTAGLGPVWDEDSRRTLDFLSRSRENVHAETVAASTQADGLIVVMSRRGMAETDTDMLDAFLGPDAATRSPVTAVGVITKVEELWPKSPDPMATARELIARLTARPAIRRLMFEVTPVCGLLAETATRLSDEDLEDLRALARVPPERLQADLLTAQVFSRADRDLPLTPGRRAALHERFSGYGLLTATGLVREGADTPSTLRAALEDASGVNGLRRTVNHHFAHRSETIKIRMVAGMAITSVRRLRHSLTGEDRFAADAVERLLTGFLTHEPALRELDLLHQIATGQLVLTLDDQEQLLALVGARGRGVHARLGLPPATPLDEARRRAHELAERWLPRTALGFPGGNRATARIVHDRCQNLIAHIDAARRHLEDPR
ncbi:dynamin family protein [Streptomyces sp. NPDC008159]|uniref:dynamin family protein n=1 Tax=Streptomyces sp. NPDC008159 TaxID=3364817 RepID=UPI0036E101F6